MSAPITLNPMQGLDDLPLPCCLIDTETLRLDASNIAAQEFFSASNRALQKRDLTELFEPVTDFTTLIQRVHTERAPIVLRELIFPQGEVELTLYPTATAHVGVLLNPQRIRATRQQQGRSIQSLGQMIGHELKNPLAGIKGAAQLLRDDITTDDGRALLDLISSEIDRIRRLADRLQTFGDMDGVDTSRVNIHTLLRNARKLMTPTADAVFFTEDYDPSLPHIIGDSDALMQVLVNLIKNAVEAMNGSGEITLRTRSRAGARRGDVGLPIEIQIIDTGPGLPSHMVDRVFEPFVTSKPSGQGLGLALVAKVVAAHGGLVELDSIPGRTRFSILLPAAANTDTSHGL